MSPANAQPANAHPVAQPLAELVAGLLRDIPDFPRPGVLFRDITPLLADGAAFGEVTRHLAGRHTGSVDTVAGIEARGFIFGAALAHELGVGFLPIRKAGKLPGRTVESSYQLEYGTATIQIHADSFTGGERVLVVDDVLATGGTAGAACELIEQAGGRVIGFDAVLELGFLGGRSKLQGRKTYAILTL